MNHDSMADNAKQATQDAMNDPKETMKKSGEEWLDYIRTHPIQSIAFGAVIFLALKEMMK